MWQRIDWHRAAGVLVVLSLHGGVGYGLWNAQVFSPPPEVAPLFVNFINLPPPPMALPVIPQPPKPVKTVKPKVPPPARPKHYHLAAETPLTSPQDAVEPLPPPEPVVESPPPPLVELPLPVAIVQKPSPSVSPAPKPAQPAGLVASDLAVACLERKAPVYPAFSRRLGETGKVVLRVELDETGRVSAAQVLSSSGSPRLDAAALAAVGRWRCKPAQLDGQAVRSVATQPFNFTLEGR